MSITSKICPRCKLELPLALFYKSRRCKYGVDSWCKKCKDFAYYRYMQTPKGKKARANASKNYLSKDGILKRRREWTHNWITSDKGRAWNKEYQCKYRERKKMEATV